MNVPYPPPYIQCSCFIASNLYALLPLLLLQTPLLLIQLPLLLIQCSCSLYLCSLCFCFVSLYILCSGLKCFNSLCPAPFAPTLYLLAFDTAHYSPNSMLLFLMPLLPMCTSSYPLASYVPASKWFNSLCPASYAPTPYVLASDPAPCSPNSVLLFVMPLLLMCLCFVSLVSYASYAAFNSCVCSLLLFSFLLATEPYAFDPWQLELKSRQGSS